MPMSRLKTYTYIYYLVEKRVTESHISGTRSIMCRNGFDAGVDQGRTSGAK